MLRPNNFGFNSETKVTNSFQHNINENENIIKDKAIHEFDEMVKTLESNDISVNVFNDKVEILPDSVFMNNWVSIFPDGRLVTYPLLNNSRRKERRNDIVNQIIEKFDITEYIDLSDYEKENLFLEGTGSVVFDYKNKLAFACLSERTSETVFNMLCDRLGYKGFIFSATNLDDIPIYHTNVMMCIANKYALICTDSINDPLERSIIINALKSTGKQIIELSHAQLNQFAGNSFEITDNKGKSKLIMSRTAHSSLVESQELKIRQYSEIVPVNISIIERVGGGSARCMLTGVNC
jgi:hypothetical protein